LTRRDSRQFSGTLPNTPSHPDATRGAVAATSSFLFWGLVPVYWKQMKDVAAIELITHRIVWSLLFLLGVLAWQKKFGDLRPAFAGKRLSG